MATIHAGAMVCNDDWRTWIEDYFERDLKYSDYKNMSFADHLEHFLHPNWTDSISFCMDGRELGPTEAYSDDNGVCFFVNAKDEVYDHSRYGVLI